MVLEQIQAVEANNTPKLVRKAFDPDEDIG